MRRALLLALALTCAASAARAHPGSGIVVDRLGRVFFVLFGPNRIMVLEPDGRARVFAEDDRWLRLHHLVMDAAGNLYTASDHDGRVWRITPDGQVEVFFDPPRSWSARGPLIGQGGDPFAIDDRNRIYALDRLAGSEILRITPAGEVTAFAGGSGFGSLHFSTMAWGPDGDLYVSDASRVWRIGPDGKATRLDWGDQPPQLATGLALDAGGTLYVADYAGRRVLRWQPDGGGGGGGGGAAMIAPGTARLGLAGPVGVAVGPAGELFIADHSAWRMDLWRVTPDRARRVYVRHEPGGLVPAALLTLLVGTLALHTWQRRPAGVLDWLWWTGVIGVLVAGIWLVTPHLPFLSYGRHLLAALFAAAAVASYRRIAVR